MIDRYGKYVSPPFGCCNQLINQSINHRILQVVSTPILELLLHHRHGFQSGWCMFQSPGCGEAKSAIGCCADIDSACELYAFELFVLVTSEPNGANSMFPEPW